MTTQPASILSMGLAALSSFLIGGLWYSPLLFGKRWQQEVGLSDATLSQSMAKTFTLAAICSVLWSVNLGFFIGKTGMPFALFAGLATGLGFVAPGLVVSYAFARRSAALIAIDAGYHAVAFALAGAIIGFLG